MGHTFGTLMTYGWVAAKVPTSIRIEGLSFSHHQLVAPLAASEQKKWLKQALRNKWSTRALKQAIYEHDAPRDDREAAQRWAYNVVEYSVPQASFLARNCTITEKEGDYLDTETIREMTKAIGGVLAAWTGAAKAIQEYQEKRAAVAGRASLLSLQSSSRVGPAGR
jgi:hypothetical protein